MTDPTLTDALEDLRDVHERMQPPDMWTMDGICDALPRRSRDVVKSQFHLWPEYSGHETFPVPGVDGEKPGDAYMACSGECSEEARMWDRETSEYADARWRLLEWLIEHFEQLVRESP